MHEHKLTLCKNRLNRTKNKTSHFSLCKGSNLFNIPLSRQTLSTGPVLVHCGFPSVQSGWHCSL